MIAYFQELLAQFTNPVTAIAQIFGLIPMVLGFFVFRNIKRNTSIAIKAVADGLWSIHFLLLGEITGGVINGINVARGICFAQKGRHKWASGVWMPVIFCTATVVSSALSWTGWESLLPMAGTSLAVVGYWCREPSHLRRFNFAGIFLWLVYSILTFSIPTIACNGVYLISIVLTEIRLHKQNDK